MNCIYCKNGITELNKSIEHVFPKSFGCPDTWTIDCVCCQCNNTFGGTLERYLAGDSIEGLWRLQKVGSRSKKAIRHMRLKLNIPDEDRYGNFRGVMVYADFSKLDSLFLPAQVLVLDEKGKRKIYLLEDLNKEKVEEIKNSKLELFANDEANYNIAIEQLKQSGVKLNLNLEKGLPDTAINNNGKLDIIIDGTMDSVIFRTIAKIAFNYLAKTKGADYALNEKFDIIREYIKVDLRPNFPIVTIKKGHILSEETNKKYFFEGHIFTTETKGNDIIGKVSLSNTFDFYYRVWLSEIGPVWHDLAVGHGYSLEEDKIVPLFNPTFLNIRAKLRRMFGF